MPSQLTRTVFRRLLSNRAFVFKCPTRPSVFPRHAYDATRLLPRAPRRTFLGFGQKKPPKPKDADIAPGLGPMLDLYLMDHIKARPPETAELIKAFQKYFLWKSKRSEPVNHIHIGHALRTFRHLKTVNSAEHYYGLTRENLIVARNAISRIPKGDEDKGPIVDLTKELVAELGSHGEEMPPEERVMFDLRNKGYLIKALAQTGHASDAREELQNLAKSFGHLGKAELNRINRFWPSVLQGFADEGNETELLKTVEMVEAATAWDRTYQTILTRFYASRNDVAGTKQWFAKERGGRASFAKDLLADLIRFSIRNNEHDWCSSIFREMLERPPPRISKGEWDMSFQWAAGILRKGVDDIKQMMDVMVRTYEDTTMRPDVETINGLVDLAIFQDDPYRAERYITLGQQLGIQPNAATFILQMNYRISVGDMSGAHKAYESLQREEVLDKVDIPVINRYIRALCCSEPLRYDRIVDIVSDLHERKERLEADTIVEIVRMHMGRDEDREAIDVLQLHSFHHTKSERFLLRDTLYDICMDSRNSTLRAWNAYTIVRQIFNGETSREMRTTMMKEFFRRGRVDMALHVFGHMRQHLEPAKRPTVDTYTDFFYGISKFEDEESLEIVHNMLKLDSAIEPTTKLYNALMLAFINTEEPRKAYDFWIDITNSLEGPSYNSLQIIFMVCQKAVFGERRAKEVWNKIRRMDIEVTPEVFTAYVGALAGHRLHEEAMGLVENMEADFGFGPDKYTLGALYNAVPGQERKDAIEKWAQQRWPAQWAELGEEGQQTLILTRETLFNLEPVVKP